MIPRKTRDQLADLIQKQLDSCLNDSEFDDRVYAIWEVTDDLTVRSISEWLLNGDVPAIEMPRFSKEQWDVAQRLLLVLRSDAEIQLRKTHIWSSSQWIAAVGLIGFTVLSLRFGWGSQLLIVSIPFGHWR